MAISPIDGNSFALYSPYDIPEESIVVNNINTIPEDGNAISANSGIEPTATSVAISAIPPESIELQELQNNIVSSYDDLKSENISKEDFASRLEELGVTSQQAQIENQIDSNNNQNSEPIQELTSALIESVKGNSQGGGEIELSSYASIMDIVNKQTQPASINEQLQAYTQNLRN